MFWDDTPPPKPPKAKKPKRTPPNPVWLLPDYLPNLEEARNAVIPLYTDGELVNAALEPITTAGAKRHRLVFDVEVYHNYFLAAFQSISTGKVTYVEMKEGLGKGLDIRKLEWLMRNFTLVSYNGIHFDVPIIALALAGKTCEELKYAANRIITDGWRPADVIKELGLTVKRYRELSSGLDHIDLIEVAPGVGVSLKLYGGRMHTKRMQDLPFHPEAVLTPDQIIITRWYCVNDLVQTASLHNNLKEQLELRETLSNEYGTDLRSRSDAQIAETVISDAVCKRNGWRHVERPVIEPGTVYRYNVPKFIQYETPLMNWALDVVRNALFIVGEHGSVDMPEELKALHIPIAGGVYRMGIGGLHSSEESIAHYADENTIIVDRDVTSYYPEIILGQNLYPHHLGPAFLQEYRQIVDRRVAAKRAGNTVVADSLKITINGSFGKLGSKYSNLYSPDLLIQVTITGQLALLMLMERLELRGISVVSANTDGIVIKCSKHRKADLEAIIAWWERDTGFQTEEAIYKAVFSRDVNNYIAMYAQPKKGKDGSLTYAKTKGEYAPTGLQKNPTNAICIDSVLELLAKNVPIHQTVRTCTDVRKFVSVRTVKGGAVKDGEYLGKTIRWYYATGGAGEIVYANSGNKVPRSDCAKPLMLLPDKLPIDVDFDWYEAETHKILRQISYYTN